MLRLLIMILLSYLLGSIPTSIIAGKLLQGIDIREHGSGNAGATNVFRVMGWKIGLAVLLIDMAKGLIPTILFYKIAADSFPWDVVNLQIIAGISAVFGHIWTLFAGFKGGKGVGTGAGMCIGLLPVEVLVALFIFIVVVALTRYVSLGSIIAAVSLPVTLLMRHYLFDKPIQFQLLVFSLFIPLLIIYTHRSNIQRLLAGEENKLQFQKTR